MNSLRVLEIGCGTGRKLPALVKNDTRVYAVDFDFDAVSTAHSLIQDGVSFSVALAQQLPFPEQVFHEVYCTDVLHWASGKEEFEAMWREAWRVLKPAGAFYACTRCAEVAGVSQSGNSKWFLPDSTLLENLAVVSEADWVKSLEIKMGEATLALRKKA